MHLAGDGTPENPAGPGFGIGSSKKTTINIQSGMSLGLMADRHIVMYAGRDDPSLPLGNVRMTLANNGSITGVSGGGATSFHTTMNKDNFSSYGLSVTLNNRSVSGWTDVPDGIMLKDYRADSKIHILGVGNDGAGTTSEIYLTNTNIFVHAAATTHITGITSIKIAPGGTGHTEGGDNYMLFGTTKLTVHGYSAENQEGIYARFA
jgi:hypothetical protein